MSHHYDMYCREFEEHQKANSCIDRLQSSIKQIQAKLDTAKAALKSMNKHWCNRVHRVAALHAELDTEKEAVKILTIFLEDAKKQIKTANKRWNDLREDNRRLKEFARYVIEKCWSLFDPDGNDIQKLAEKLGLIVPHIVEIDDDYDVDFEVGDSITIFSETLQGECKQNVFMTREERIAAFHKARGEKWSEEREQWIPEGE